jgi:methionyl-tRNA formyltransferase
MEEIYEIGGALDLVLTLPDEAAPSKSGRVHVDEFCRERRIPLLKVDNINDQVAVQAIRKAKIDWLFIIGWSQIAGKAVLDAPTQGCLGMHPTLLPEGRGRAAIPWAILKGLKRTGVTLFKLDEGVDSGPILGQHVIEVDQREDAGTLYQKVTGAHRALIGDNLKSLEEGTGEFSPQDDTKASYWPTRRPEDGLLHSGMKVRDADLLVRAVTHPYPGAFYQTSDGLVRVWRGSQSAAEQSADDSVLPLRFVDGYLYATDYDQLEPVVTGPSSNAALA